MQRLLLLPLIVSLSLAGELTSYRWNPKKGEKYLRGRVGGIQFQTSEREFLTSSPPQKVRAFNSQNKVTRWLKPIRGKRLQKSIPLDTRPYNTDTDAEPIEPEESTATFFNPSTLRDEPDAVSTGRLRLFASFGLGKEKLSSQGGISDFDSDSNIGGTFVDVAWSRLDQQQKPTWGVTGSAGGYLHKTKTTTTDATTQRQTEDEESYFRSHLFFAPTMSFEPLVTGQFFNAGLGIGLYRVPVLEIADPEQGTALLIASHALSPTLHLGYEAKWSEHVSNAVRVRYANFSLIELSSYQRYQLLLSTSYWIDSMKFMSLAFEHIGETATRKVDCPAVNNCRSKATADHSVNLINLGFGVEF